MENKNFLNMIQEGTNRKSYKIIIFNLLILIGCKNHKHEVNENCYQITFMKPMLDTIIKYCNGIDTTCKIVFSLDVDILRNIYRVNIYTPNDSTVLNTKYRFWTQINNHKIRVETGIEKFLKGSSYIEELVKINTLCDLNLFVIYDSSNIIKVIKNLNDFNFDLSPSKQRPFLPKLE